MVSRQSGWRVCITMGSLALQMAAAKNESAKRAKREIIQSMIQPVITQVIYTTYENKTNRNKGITTQSKRVQGSVFNIPRLDKTSFTSLNYGATSYRCHINMRDLKIVVE